MRVSEQDREVLLAVQAIQSLFEQTDDPAERFKRLTALLTGWPDLHREVRAMRQKVGEELYDGGNGLNYEAIGQLIDVTESRARHIVLGITNPSRTKRKKEEKERAEREAGGAGPEG